MSLITSTHTSQPHYHAVSYAYAYPHTSQGSAPRYNFDDIVRRWNASYYPSVSQGHRYVLPRNRTPPSASQSQISQIASDERYARTLQEEYDAEHARAVAAGSSAATPAPYYTELSDARSGDNEALAWAVSYYGDAVLESASGDETPKKYTEADYMMRGALPVESR